MYFSLGLGLPGDLEYAIFSEVGCMDQETPKVALVRDSQVFHQAFPCESKDVSTDWIVTPTRMVTVRNLERRQKGLDRSFIRQHRELLAGMRPLKELYDLKSRAGVAKHKTRETRLLE